MRKIASEVNKPMRDYQFGSWDRDFAIIFNWDDYSFIGDAYELW